MRRWLLIGAIALQVLVLAFMAGKHEFIARTGTVIYLRTAPIDPRDLFRGDYVRLRYEASVIPAARVDAPVAELAKKRSIGTTVYASLIVDENGLSDVAGLSERRPASGPFLKGRLAGSWRFGMSAPDSVAVEYGIEAYYVQQGKGVEMEEQLGTRTTVQTPLEMEVAVGGDGTAVIRGHRWSPLGIGLELIESPRRDQPAGRRSARLRLTLRNASDKPLAIVNLPGLCSLVLEPFSPGQSAQPAPRPECDGLTPADADVVALAPQDERSFVVDLDDPAWRVLSNNTLVASGTLPWNERFRLRYRPPSAEATADLRDAAIIWHGSLPSRAFHGQGNID